MMKKLTDFQSNLGNRVLWAPLRYQYVKLINISSHCYN
jgi:hypothetical protein